MDTTWIKGPRGPETSDCCSVSAPLYRDSSSLTTSTARQRLSWNSHGCYERGLSRRSTPWSAVSMSYRMLSSDRSIREHQASWSSRPCPYRYRGARQIFEQGLCFQSSGSAVGLPVTGLRLAIRDRGYLEDLTRQQEAWDF